MITSSDRRLIAFLWVSGVAESTGDVRILIVSCEIAVCAHAQYKIGNKNSPEPLARRRAVSGGSAFTTATFSSFYLK